MKFIEKYIHTLIADYPFIRIPLVALYQRILYAFPSKNYQIDKQLIQIPGYFFGFHDKCPWSYDNSNLLAHKFDLKKTIDKIEEDPIKIGLFEDNDFQKFRVLGTSNAWNWQQGSSLQWIGKTKNIIYNDFFQGKDIAKIITSDSRLVKTLPCHIVNVSNDGKFALTYSFERLGHCMPNYGYRFGNCRSQSILLPENEKLGIIDLETSKTKELFSLKEIAKIDQKDSMKNSYHFFSHCLFSPNSQRFLFFHRYLRPNKVLITRMFSSDLLGKELFLFPGNKFSHIAWKDDKTILTYCQYKGKMGYYIIKDLDGKSINISNKFLNSDGHPQFSTDRRYILTDTYPDRFRNQWLILYDFKINNGRILVRYRIPFKYRYGRRCDFHPRWNRDDSMICFDSAHKKVRSLCILVNPLN